MEKLMNLIQNFDQISSIALIASALGGLAISKVVGQKKRDPKETFTNFSIFLIGWFLKMVALGSLELSLLIWLFRLVPFHIAPTPVSCVALTIMADFLFYWVHRIEHEIQILWAIHSVHHSSQEFNTSTALRLGWLGFFPQLGSSLILVAFGFNPLLAILANKGVLVYQYWIHTETIGKIGWFDRVFNSPSNHRVHHASNPEYLDKNFGGVLMIWDRLFGTYCEENGKPTYGLVEPIRSQNPVIINFGYLFKVLHKSITSSSISRALSVLVRNPNEVHE